MDFKDKLDEVKEFYYISLARYGLSNQFLQIIQNNYPMSSDEKPILIGKATPLTNNPSYEFKTSIGEFKNSLKKHENILINNCIILLISSWLLHCKEHKIEPYLTPEISEIILYRNCIIHNKGFADKKYLKYSKLKKYKLGEKLEFSPGYFDTFLSYFEGK